MIRDHRAGLSALGNPYRNNYGDGIRGVAQPF